MQVDPAKLDTAAREAEDLGRQWKAAAVDVEPETRAAIGGLGHGFQLRTELDRVVSAHLVEAAQFEQYLQQFGEALSMTAADYRRSDTTAGNRFWYLKDR